MISCEFCEISQNTSGDCFRTKGFSGIYSKSFFYSNCFFCQKISRITGLHGRGGGGGISLTPHYHFHRLHRHLDISRAITAESSPLHISSSRTGTWKLWFPNASRYPLSSASPWFHEIAILRHDKISKGILGLVNCCGFNSVNTKNNVI